MKAIKFFPLHKLIVIKIYFTKMSKLDARYEIDNFHI